MCFDCIIIVFWASIVVALQESRPVVRIPQGPLVGIKVYADSGGIADAYLGVPYATPPLGKLRFTAPQPHDGWNSTYQALTFGPSCPQLPLRDGINESENCLYLNIWTPETARYPLPVVIFFDGYEFAKGGRTPISGQDLAIEDVVVVTVNYRLNVFGFLCLESSQVRGNMGLLDQYMSMVWVRENIKHFGGDPDKVTIFGYSAGAASVALHLISSRTAGYFQRAILSSGSALSPWHLTKDAKSASWKIAQILGCLNNYYHSMLQCLRSKSTQDILKAYEEYCESGNVTSMLLPVIDTFLHENDRYLPTHPEHAFRNGTFKQVPILTGITRPIVDIQYVQWAQSAGQGYMQLEQYMELSKIPEITKRYHLKGKNYPQILEAIKWRYITSSDRNVKLLLQQLKNLEYESKIEAPHFLQLQHLQKSYTQPIYVYDLENPGFILNATDAPITSDLLLLFSPWLLNQLTRRRLNSKEFRFSQHVKQLWKNFVTFGNPTPGNQINPWKRYNSNERFIDHLSIEQSKPNGDENFALTQRVTFWNQLLPKLLEIHQEDMLSPKELQNFYGSGYRHAMYTLVGLVIVLLALLLICILLIKRRAKERSRQFQMVY
ncbi:liver carboxylesterase 4-like isoform X2 [Photinus pyralis]|uniref:Carboxylic ester hydrolase n=1 Tax=Photinus pyralis TaxID=7054 RepID=A0A1Y1MWI9_PHOPY|nr:liver carboxylesterase 4-like isoform X2 [Photinus pyralis]